MFFWGRETEIKNTMCSEEKIIFWKKMVAQPSFGVRLRRDVVREVCLGSLASVKCSYKEKPILNRGRKAGKERGDI